MTEYIATLSELKLYDGSKIGTRIELSEPLQEIVRCRDCENYEYREHLGRSYCCGEYATEPDGYCAWGDRRKEGGE